MISVQELKSNKELARSKSVASMCGLAIGDSLGDASRKVENQKGYGYTTDFTKSASWSTDDTEFSLLTAKMLLDCKGDLTREVVHQGWMENVVVQDEFNRGGYSEIEAAINLSRGLKAPLSGKFNTYQVSDGAAMRIAPVGIVYAGDPEKAARIAEIDAEISHYAEGIYGAQAVAAAVSVAMVDATIDEIIDAALKAIPDDSWLYYAINKALEVDAKANYDFYDAWMVMHDELWTTYFSGVPEAIGCTFGMLKLTGQDFKGGLITACNFGRDADTIGAVAGAILGAKYGLDAVPDKWVQKTRYPTGTCLTFTKGMDIVEVGNKLAEIIH